ncbi:MAG: SDR family NAD(P)-dependent oxidoreductase [Bacillus subtilis]|nr:SDR family NAD(P)-dependent oxidoreductase [Bacillus subtilis]
MTTLKSGDVVLVTGATSGLGKACAERLAAGGFRVYGTGRNPEASGSVILRPPQTGRHGRRVRPGCRPGDPRPGGTHRRGGLQRRLRHRGFRRGDPPARGKGPVRDGIFSGPSAPSRPSFPPCVPRAEDGSWSSDRWRASRQCPSSPCTPPRNPPWRAWSRPCGWRPGGSESGARSWSPATIARGSRTPGRSPRSRAVPTPRSWTVPWG